MGEQIRGKVFKSGNSVSLRLPKSLGFREGDDVVLVPHANGAYTLYRSTDAKEVLLSLYGSFSPGFMSDGRDESEQEERDWSKPDTPIN